MSFFSTLANLFKKEPAPEQSTKDLSLTPMSSGSYMHGGTIKTSFVNAMAQAQKHNRPVFIDVNGIEGMLADPQSTYEGLKDTYQKAQAARQELGHMGAQRTIAQSPEGMRLSNALDARREAQIGRQQNTMTQLMDEMPARLMQGKDSTVAWIGEFATIADNSHLTYDKQSVVDGLKGAGYSADMLASTQRGNAGLGDRIIGAAIQQMEQMGTLHPGLSHMAKDYGRQNAHNQAKGLANSIAQGMNAPAQQRSAQPAQERNSPVRG